ncbi:MAG: hypothetical protein HC883_02000, partial [Bdellovibrionaceae bacterium]|nr:hypothetical protein [Pseudobdellovibrionaceae bacterium]
MVTQIDSGTGLLGGPITTYGTLNVDVGVTTGKIVQVAAGNKLPVIDGSDLTNINAVKLQTRDVGNVAPNANDVLRWNGSMWLPAAVTSGTVVNVASGTGLLGGPITNNGTLSVDVGVTAGKIVQVAAGNKLPVIDGSDLTNINAAKLQTRDVGNVAPNANDVLRWNGSMWLPAAVTSGTVTSIEAGTGLLGGTITNNGTISVDVGVTTGDIVQVAAGNKLPVIDGSNLTNVNAISLQGYAVQNVAPTDGYVLKWNNSASRWEPTANTDNGITQLTGDISASGSGSVAATLTNGVVTTPKLFTNPGVNRLVMTDATTGATLEPLACGNGEVLVWGGATGWDCATVANALGTGYIVDGGNTRGAAITIGTKDNYALNFETNDTTKMIITTAGDVGIGTTSPDSTAKLTVTDGTQDAKITI